MKKLHSKVNIVPVIAKADVLTKKEVSRLKLRILDEIKNNGIKIYPLPDCDSDEDEDYKEQVRQLKDAVPFAVCGSTTLLEVKGKKVRGRLYPWGVVEVENPEHCDFIKLRTMLMCDATRRSLFLKVLNFFLLQNAHAGPPGSDTRSPLRELPLTALGEVRPPKRQGDQRQRTLGEGGKLRGSRLVGQGSDLEGEGSGTATNAGDAGTNAGEDASTTVNAIDGLNLCKFNKKILPQLFF